MLLNNSISDGKAKTCSFTCCLGGEKRIIDLFYILAVDPGARILNDYFNLRIDCVGQNTQFPAFRHGITGIHKQIQKHLLQLACVSVRYRIFCSQLTLDMYARAFELMLEERKRVRDDLMNVDFCKLCRVGAGKIEQVVYDF